MKPREKIMMHLIFRRCEPEQFDSRRKDYETVGIEFESAWYEGSDSADKYPHAHCIVYTQWAKKTLQDRLAKQFPQYSSQHVFKDVDSSEYEGNVLQYVCKEWNPLITDADILAKYEIHKGCWAFKRNMNLLKKTESKKVSFNETILTDFKKYYDEKGGHVKDVEIFPWLEKQYRCFRKDLDHNVLIKKFWLIKNCFEIKDKYRLTQLCIRTLNISKLFI